MYMEKKKMIILFSIILGIFVLISFLLYMYFFYDDNKLDTLLINDKKEATVKQDVGVEDTTGSSNEEAIINDSESKIDNTVNSYSEEDVVSYFDNMWNEVEKSSTFKEKFKEYFITIVDFIFYDKEIKGYTFNELSGSAKAKIIGIALKIDSKIEEYVPNYKEAISSTYRDVKERLITLYMDVATDICKNNEEGCNTVKDIFADIKSTCKIGWDFIKNLIASGTSKIKEWYEIYSGK